MPRFDVTGLGRAACDYIIRLPSYPGPDEKVRADDLAISGGGTIGTALVAVSRLGRSAAWCGSVGDDAFGRFILEALDHAGIDTSRARVVPGARSAFAFCVATPPQRNVFSVSPTTPPLELAEADLDYLLDTQYVHLDLSEIPASLALAQEARKRGVAVSIDLQRDDDAADQLLDTVDVAVTCEAFARTRFPGLTPAEAVLKLWRPGMTLAAVTLGAEGVVATEGGAPYTIAAAKVEPEDLADTTGAGDVFHGALLVSLLGGHGAHDALAWAAKVAALSLRALGGQAGIPTHDELGT